MGRKMKLSKKQIDEVLEGVKSGDSFSYWAKRTNVATVTIMRICKDRNVVSKFKEPEQFKDGKAMQKERVGDLEEKIRTTETYQKKLGLWDKLTRMFR